MSFSMMKSKGFKFIQVYYCQAINECSTIMLFDIFSKTMVMKLSKTAVVK